MQRKIDEGSNLKEISYNNLLNFLSTALFGLLIVETLISIGNSVAYSSPILILIFLFIYFFFLLVIYTIKNEAPEYLIFATLGFFVLDFLVLLNKTAQLRNLGLGVEKSAPPVYVFLIYATALILGCLIWLIHFKINKVSPDYALESKNIIKTEQEERKWKYLESKRSIEERKITDNK